MAKAMTRGAWVVRVSQGTRVERPWPGGERTVLREQGLIAPLVDPHDDRGLGCLLGPDREEEVAGARPARGEQVEQKRPGQ